MNLILNIDNAKFIKKVMDYIHNEKSDFWNDLNTKEEAEIKKGIEQLNKRRRVPFEDVLKKIS